MMLLCYHLSKALPKKQFGGSKDYNYGLPADWSMAMLFPLSTYAREDKLTIDIALLYLK